ncbi:hypothetical protein ABTY61_23005 [Kitasatospora sp. NPDC096128]|uniref:hypothetical protein n=1 Tax=Kitasatospora sp. NPDC096128 TaxID=3155547 RepID=UPI00332DA59E
MTRSSFPQHRRHDLALGVVTLLESRYHHYLDYAGLLLPPEEVQRAVHSAAVQATSCWQTALAAPDATAATWTIVRVVLVARARPQALASLARLTASQQDVVLMRHALGWSDATIITVTGTDRCALAAASRALARIAVPEAIPTVP